MAESPGRSPQPLPGNFHFNCNIPMLILGGLRRDRPRDTKKRHSNNEASLAQPSERCERLVIFQKATQRLNEADFPPSISFHSEDFRYVNNLTNSAFEITPSRNSKTMGFFLLLLLLFGGIMFGHR